MKNFLLILIIPTFLFSVDPPHWSSPSTYEDCETSCHLTHSSLGSPLTQATSNVNSCLSCHNPSGLASDLPVSLTEKATPGISGRHHNFDVPSNNLNYGAENPQNTQMSQRVMGGNIVCSTCHNQHSASSSMRGRPKISNPKKIGGSGTGNMYSSGNYTGAGGLWYLVEIDNPGSQATATFKWSKDNGITWMGENINCGNGNPVNLDNGVKVTFNGGSGAFQLGDRWEFYASYPFLRVAMDLGNNSSGDKFCRDCHRSWTMTHIDVETYDGNKKSHPVGIGLNANGGGYDRSSPLDGNGNPQGGPGEDGVSSNNLKFDQNGNLQCFTCHNVHYGDDNTLTEDLP